MDGLSPCLDKPLLYGKYQPLPTGGYVIEPLTQICLTASGAVHGLDNHRKYVWQPYGTGFVLVREGTAVPWCYFATRTNDGMLVGLFNHDEAAQHMVCLFPHVPLPAETKIIYLVATCQKYFDRTMPLILAELADQEVPSSQIKVVINNSDAETNWTEDGVEYASTRHNAWEYSALYAAPLRWDFDYAMLIHDTSKLLPGFREKVSRVNGFLPFNFYPAGPQARCVVGLYAKSFLLEINAWLQSIHQISKADGIMVECSGELLLRARRCCAMGARHRDIGISAGFAGEQKRMLRLFPGACMQKMIGVGKR